MTHNEQPVEQYHYGDALELHVTIIDSDGETLSLVDTDAEWFLMDSELDDPETDALLTKDSGSTGGISYPDPDAGELLVKIDTNDIDATMVGNLHHRLRVTDNDGDRATVFTGDFEVLE